MSSLLKFPQFIYRGFTEYTRQGFLENSKRFNGSALDVDMTGKTVVITGANSGLGYATATEIAKKGATVCILCRNEARGKQALDEIVRDTGNKNIFLYVIDLSQMKSIKKFYDNFNPSGELASCHVLIHNAGMIAESYSLTDEGIESSFATNTLGMYYLNKLMLPNLEASRPSRVVVVSSGGMYNERLNVNDLQFKSSWFYSGVNAYAQNKRQSVELATKWNELYREKGIKFFSMHPGWASTPGVSKSLPMMDSYIGKDRLRTPLQGADTILWLACSREPLEYTRSDFFFDRQATSPHLMLAFTQSTPKEVDSLLSQCEELVQAALNHI
ncbi:Dehydrogenase/reductase SDR member 12 [Entomophthora muscae]|uniref:Dehydrogenase/reductase SDR member 12 n=1 Tax=Entomophthora muscae TaxID=34485 RepID=A0ACC2UNW0_9FUNG|nr:Dehydrogenase/reductase SDR member 12 [Entomophthora muscae]